MIDLTPNINTAKPKLKFFNKLKLLLKNKPKKFYLILGGVAITLSAFGFLTVYILTMPVSKPVQTNVQKPKPKSKPAPIYYSPLTGSIVANEATTKLPVTGIMIENSPDARPQSGLKQAGIIYEAVAEGGITRFLALYQESKPGLIGPVRSLRMYYLDWATPYQASIVHFGGSAGSLNEVSNGQYRNLDLMQNSIQYYWRAGDRYAPHNVYTNSEKLDALNNAKGYTSSIFTAWPRLTKKPTTEPNATNIDINISGPLYNSHYTYDTANNYYLRSIAGSPSTDREDGQFTPNVVIAIKVDMVKVLQDGYREDITTSGSGEATVFQNGIAISGTWSKNSRSAPLQFFDSSGQEIKLNPGQTWVVAVSNGNGSVVWQ